MYRVKARNWLKYYDFILLDIVSLQIAFVLSYCLRHSFANPYTQGLYRDMSIVITLIDITLIFLLGTLDRVMKRGYFAEACVTLRHDIILELLSICYLFTTQRGTAYSRTVLYGMGMLYFVVSYFTRAGWKAVVRRRMKNGGKASLLIVVQDGIADGVIRKIVKNNFERYSICGIALLSDDAEAKQYSYAEHEPEFMNVSVAVGAENYPRRLYSRHGNSAAIASGGEFGVTMFSHFKQHESPQKKPCQKSFDASRINTMIAGLSVVANDDTLADYVCREWVDEAFIFSSKKEYYPEKVIQCLQEGGITVHLNLDGVRSSLGGKQIVEQICGYTVLTSGMNCMTVRQAALKRFIDIIGGIFGCIATVFLVLIIGPIIYIQSPGPIIFKQTRIGRNGKRFTFYKFRSMYLDADERKKELQAYNRVSDGLMFKLDFDPRIIGYSMMADGTVKKGIGNFIRDWSLDEFPQFWNVLKGDMSLVGTRPPTIDEWEKYDLHHRARMAARPGITGMWQVSGRSNITDFEEVVKLDTEYIRDWSLALDCGILWRTIVTVMGRKGSM